MIIRESLSMKEMLEEIDINHTRIVFLINDKDQLSGCISQGDIIRSMINGVSLRVESKNIAKLNPIFIEESENALFLAKEKLIKNKIHAIPIVDSNKKIIKIVTLLDILQNDN